MSTIVTNQPQPGATTPQESRLVTAEELASIAQMHPVSIRRLVSQGKLPCYRFGRAVRFNVSEVLDAIHAKGASHEND